MGIFEKIRECAVMVRGKLQAFSGQGFPRKETKERPVAIYKKK